MKIEKVNENQIRCTLTREDLADRELKISELAYGTEKAKNLFRDMMRQANFEFGFEAEDIPLMIEAIPLNPDCIVLIITKVEDPEELDTRFSRFAPSVTEDADSEEEQNLDEVSDLFRELQTKQTDISALSDEQQQADRTLTRVFRFSSLQQVMSICGLIAPHYSGTSTLYKSTEEGCYFLLLSHSAEDASAFDRVCNIVSEYGTLQRSASAGSRYLAEHSEVLIRENAVQALGNS